MHGTTSIPRLSGASALERASTRAARLFSGTISAKGSKGIARDCNPGSSVSSFLDGTFEKIGGDPPAHLLPRWLQLPSASASSGPIARGLDDVRRRDRANERRAQFRRPSAGAV